MRKRCGDRPQDSRPSLILTFSGFSSSPASFAVSASSTAKSTWSCPRPTMRATDSRVAAAAGMATPDSETTLNGNQVVLEEQMLKMSESRSDYDAAIGFYQKSLGLLHMAIRKPGG